ncbi:MAG: adenylate/guanylate cyclase domain-containing protein [Anaerolineales bacterium]
MTEERVSLRSWVVRSILSVPLRFKITVPYLIIVILLAGLATFLAGQGFARTLREQFSSRIADASAQVSDGLFDFESAQLSALRSIARTDGVPAALAQGDAARLSSLVRPIVINSRLELVDILDDHGEALVTFHLEPGSSPASYVTTEATRYSNWEIVQRVLNREADEIGDKFAAIVVTPWGHVVYTAGPIVQGDELVGVVLVGEYAESLTRTLFEQSRTGVTIYAADGMPVASSLVGDATTLNPVAQGTLEAVAEFGGGRLLTRNIRAGTRDYVEALTSLYLRGESTTFFLGVALPEVLLTERSGPSAVQLVTWFLIATLAVVGLGYLIAQIIALPVFELLSASTRIAEGDLEVHVAADTSDELGNLARTFNTMVGELRQREFMRELFGRMVSEEVREAVMEGQVTLGGEIKTVTVLFTDVRDFTSLSEQMSPSEVVQVLNSYFRIVNRAINELGGTINRFGGDSSLAIFGAPVDLDPEESVRRAIDAGLRIRTGLLSANAQRLRDGLRTLDVGIGINTGEVVTGNIGSEERFEYTVIGDTVNTAARVQSLSSELQTELLITEAALNALGPNPGYVISDQGPAQLKGKRNAVNVYGVHGYQPTSGPEAEWRQRFGSYSRDILEGVYLSWSGFTPAIIAKLKGVSVRTVRRWVKAADKVPEVVVSEIVNELRIPASELADMLSDNGDISLESRPDDLLVQTKP